MYASRPHLYATSPPCGVTLYRPQNRANFGSRPATINYPAMPQSQSQNPQYVQGYQRYFGSGGPVMECGRPGDIFMDISTLRYVLYVRALDCWRTVDPRSMGRIFGVHPISVGYVLYFDDERGPMWMPQNDVPAMQDTSVGITIYQRLRAFVERLFPPAPLPKRRREEQQQDVNTRPSKVSRVQARAPTPPDFQVNDASITPPARSPLPPDTRVNDTPITLPARCPSPPDVQVDTPIIPPARSPSPPDVQFDDTPIIPPARSPSPSGAVHSQLSKSPAQVNPKPVHHYATGPYAFPITHRFSRNLVHYYWDTCLPRGDKGQSGDILFLLSPEQKKVPRAFYKKSDEWVELPFNLAEAYKKKIYHPTQAKHILYVQAGVPFDMIWMPENMIKKSSAKDSTPTISAWLSELLSKSPFSYAPRLQVKEPQLSRSSSKGETTSMLNRVNVLTALNTDLQAKCTQLERELQQHRKQVHRPVMQRSIGVGTKRIVMESKSVSTVVTASAGGGVPSNNGQENKSLVSTGIQTDEPAVSPTTRIKHVPSTVEEQNNDSWEVETYLMDNFNDYDFDEGVMLDDGAGFGSDGSDYGGANQSISVDDIPLVDNVEDEDICIQPTDTSLAGRASCPAKQRLLDVHNSQSLEETQPSSQPEGAIDKEPPRIVERLDCYQDPQESIELGGQVFSKSLATRTREDMTAKILFAKEPNGGKLVCRICMASRPRRLLVLPVVTTPKVLLHHGASEHPVFWDALSAKADNELEKIYRGLGAMF